MKVCLKIKKTVLKCYGMQMSCTSVQNTLKKYKKGGEETTRLNSKAC